MHISIDDRHVQKIARKSIPLADHKFCYAIFTAVMFSYHDNKQPYNNADKLPDDGFWGIRFFRYSNISGSVARSRDKRSGLFRPWAAGHAAGVKHNIQKKLQLVEWHMLCFRAVVRRSGSVRSCSGFFRISAEKKRKCMYCRTVCISCIVCIECIVLYFLYCTVSFVLCIFHSQDTLST